MEKYGLRPVEFLNSIDLLSERYIGCHGCMLNESDSRILKDTKAKLVHVPVSNLKLSVEQIFPHLLVKTAGVPYCFGTDGCASNNHLDIIETMKFASLLAKFSSQDPTALHAKEAFDTATKTAARIFRLGNWEIQVGNTPDIILIDLARPEFIPNFDIYSDIVYASNGTVVDTVISMGKVLMENRYVPGEEDLMDKARKVARALIAR
jgi:5-methylthioadenosine/S-adenosylhomocysteine deaminase